MPKTRHTSVLLTGVGGIVGQGILRCLENTNYRTIGVDASASAAGVYASARGYVVPMVKERGYMDRLLDICKQEDVRYVFPGLDMELPIFAAEAPRFRKAGVVLVISSPEVVNAADDKLETARFLKANGLPHPRTVDVAEGDPREVGFPLVLKPRKGGSRSVGVQVVANEKELREKLELVDRTNYIAQEHIDGDEITFGTINFSGRCLGVLAMKRTLRDGDTHKGEVIRNGQLESFIRTVAERLKPFGPCNFQLRLRQGIPYIFEINSRCSGGTALRALAGFNEPVMTLDYLEHGKAPSYEISSVSIFRYWREIVVPQSRIEDMQRYGMISDAGQRL